MTALYILAVMVAWDLSVHLSYLFSARWREKGLPPKHRWYRIWDFRTREQRIGYQVFWSMFWSFALVLLGIGVATA